MNLFSRFSFAPNAHWKGRLPQCINGRVRIQSFRRNSFFEQIFKHTVHCFRWFFSSIGYQFWSISKIQISIFLKTDNHRADRFRVWRTSYSPYYHSRRNNKQNKNFGYCEMRFLIFWIKLGLELLIFVRNVDIFPQ